MNRGRINVSPFILGCLPRHEPIPLLQLQRGLGDTLTPQPKLLGAQMNDVDPNVPLLPGDNLFGEQIWGQTDPGWLQAPGEAAMLLRPQGWGRAGSRGNTDVHPHSYASITPSPGRAAGRIRCGSQLLPEDLRWVRALKQPLPPCLATSGQGAFKKRTGKENRVCIAGERSSRAAAQPRVCRVRQLGGGSCMYLCVRVCM